MNTKSLLPLAAAMLAALSTLHAQTTRTWNGGGGAPGNWGNGTNWGGTAPVNGDNLIFAGNTTVSTTNNSAVTSVNDITFATNAGSFVFAGTAITLTGNFTNSSTGAGGLTINLSNLALSSGANHTISNAAPKVLAMYVPISGGGGGQSLNLVGTAAIELRGNNTYTGLTSVTSTANLDLFHNNSLGATGTGNGTEFTGQIRLRLANMNVSELFTMSGNAAFQFILGANQTLSGGITLTGSSAQFGTFYTDSSSNSTISGGVISSNNSNVTFRGENVTTSSTTIKTNSIQIGNGTLGVGTTGNTASSGGLVILQVAGNKWGNTTIGMSSFAPTAGQEAWNILRTDVDNALSDGTSTVFIGGNGSTRIGTLNINGRNQTIAGLVSNTGTNGNATLNNTVTSTSSATLTFSGNSTYSFGNGTNANSGVVTGAGLAVKIAMGSAGQQRFGDVNTYGGGTEITSGTLVLLHNNAAGTAGVTLTGNSSATLVVNAGINIANSITFSNTNNASSVTRLVNASTAYTTGTSGNLSSNFAGGNPNTTASFLSGNATANATLTMKFSDTSVASNDDIRKSDVFSLSGTSTDTFVLQLNVTGLTADSYIGWLDGGVWKNAIDGNTGGTPLFVSGAYSGQGLGTYGVDLGNNNVWAVLNHNSDFAAVPEPATWALLAFSLTTVMVLRRRRA